MFMLWKAVAFNLFIDLQEFTQKNLINNVKQTNEDMVLQTSEGGTVAIKK
ncbi:7163_t:CDS:2 [Cetraspora pellucida]|uniref:7163_t:CDS:1 n=1 Tax=Cetraspora pellucida TaxID=1433469 RepID=A0A9N9ES60_9GLOM|nr:7163_t:CDS:2 [Cetraspora pellucida]